MWAKHYRDFPEDAPLRKEGSGSQRAIIGCEMHEINGWGETFTPPSYKKSWLRRFLEALLLRK